ncbi:hypothetical protein ACH4TX_00390 [Streptomyces sp. NPDC021098]|uniref:hypothetical protein n=1 Tax=unclassified Streptomyces TaxID=2593676 RepID=UPI0037B7FFF8
MADPLSWRDSDRRRARAAGVGRRAAFSGADVHYDESRSPDPVTPYGAAKAAAETGVRLVHPDAVIARTSLIIGDRRGYRPLVRSGAPVEISYEAVWARENPLSADLEEFGEALAEAAATLTPPPVVGQRRGE